MKRVLQARRIKYCMVCGKKMLIPAKYHPKVFFCSGKCVEAYPPIKHGSVNIPFLGKVHK
jgi:hypothetical protein